MIGKNPYVNNRTNLITAIIRKLYFKSFTLFKLIILSSHKFLLTTSASFNFLSPEYSALSTFTSLISSSQMNPRQTSWRIATPSRRPYKSCQNINLDSGLLISPAFDLIFTSATFRATCYEDAIPSIVTNVGFHLAAISDPLPIMAESWGSWSHLNNGKFSYSVFPIIYLILASAIITWFLTVFVLTNYTIKALVLLRALTTVLSIYLFVTGALAIHYMSQQLHIGYLNGSDILDRINNLVVLNVLDLILVILLQVNQVQVIMRIFLRQKDKRFAFVVGIACTLLSQIMWAITRFYNFPADDEANDILPAFVYLIRIAMGVCYAALISVYIFTKINIIIANKALWLLTFLTCVLIYLPVAFFIADVLNSWVFELSEIFLCVTYVIGVVIPWEWYNRFNVVLKSIERNGMLGRKFYEDEIYELDRYELFDEDSINEQNSGNFDGGPSGGGSTVVMSPHEHSGTVQDTVGRIFQKTRFALVSVTDAIIATGMAIPRSVSVLTPPIQVAQQDQDPLSTSEGGLRLSAIQNFNVGRNRRDVFVYSKKRVVILEDDDQASSREIRR